MEIRVDQAPLHHVARRDRGREADMQRVDPDEIRRGQQGNRPPEEPRLELQGAGKAHVETIMAAALARRPMLPEVGLRKAA